MGQSWYYTSGGQQAGPVEWAHLQQMAASGQLNPAELVWTEGMPQWTAGSAVANLFQGPTTAPQSPYAAATASPYGAVASPYNAGQPNLNYYNPTQAGGYGPVYAGFWLRFVAYVVDAIIVGVVSRIVGVVLQQAMDLQAAAILGGIFQITLSWLYFAIQESSAAQATLGKRILSLKVTNLTGERIGFGQATGRYFGKIISAIILLVGFIMAGFTQKKQALHDIMASTLVVKQ